MKRISCRTHRGITSRRHHDGNEGRALVTTIHADEIQAGDALTWDGQPHRIIRVERHEGWAWPVAVDGSGWAIALDHHVIDVDRSPV
jgi:hypothetical protein